MVKILIINTCPKNQLWYNEFVTPIENIVKKDFKTLHHTQINNEIIKEFDRIIISGNPLGENSHLENISNFDWIKTTNKKVLGICAGMQIIGKVFGCELINNLEIGLFRILTIIPNKLFKTPSFEIYSLHTQFIKPTNEFEILAKLNKITQSFKHKEKEIYGVLFHCEVRNPKMIENFINEN